MHEKPNIEQKNNTLEITKSDQEAFDTLVHELILVDKTKEIPPLSYENRNEISTAIQADFFEYVLKNRTRKEEIIRGLPEQEITVIQTYNPFAFTPRLAELAFEKTETKDSSTHYEAKGISLNCVGNAFINSIEERLLDNTVLFGIAADHPVLFVTDKDGKQYINDGDKHKEIDGTFETKNGYSIYRTTSDTIQNEHLFFVHEPNISILHEILHNMQILKEGIKNPDNFLPDTEDDGLKISEEYQHILQSGDWEKMRKIICPEIEQSFQENAKEWNEEIERIKEERKQGKKLYMSAIVKAKNSLGFEDKTMKEFSQFIKPKVKAYKEIVNEYFDFLVLETIGNPWKVPTHKHIDNLKDLQNNATFEFYIVSSDGTHQSTSQEEMRSITREEILNLIDDSQVRDFIRDLGEVFVTIKNDLHSLYFRKRLSQNILDESI